MSGMRRLCGGVQDVAQQDAVGVWFGDKGALLRQHARIFRQTSDQPVLVGDVGAGVNDDLHG